MVSRWQRECLKTAVQQLRSNGSPAFALAVVYAVLTLTLPRSGWNTNAESARHESCLRSGLLLSAFSETIVSPWHFISISGSHDSHESHHRRAIPSFILELYCLPRRKRQSAHRSGQTSDWLLHDTNMGWLRWSSKEPIQHVLANEVHDANDTQETKPKEYASHIERVDSHVDAANMNTPSVHGQYPLQPTSLPDAQLPFITGDIVQSSKHGYLWLVVDDIVYDCADFEHPGGATVIESFRGENCSWQFWRFHNKTHMHEFGRPLRIGRTSGVKNRFKERPKFVGLSKIGADDW